MFRIIFVLIVFLFSPCVLAFSGEFPNNNHFVLGLSIGPTWTFGNKSQTFNLQEDIVKTYQAQSNNNTLVTGEIFLGWQNQWCSSSLNQSFISQIGVNFAGAGTSKPNGNIWEDADPTFNNYNYTYKVNHAHFAIEGRLINNTCYLFDPYISASMGVGYNRAYDFIITPKIVEEVPAPSFRSHTMTTFTYTVGIGLQSSITPQFQAAIGYEFADWGKVQLARAPGQTLNQGLSLNHLYANVLQLSLFYIV